MHYNGIIFLSVLLFFFREFGSDTIFVHLFPETEKFISTYSKAKVSLSKWVKKKAMHDWLNQTAWESG